jgi:hypothetical protein
MDKRMMDYWDKAQFRNPPIHSSINPFIRVNRCPSVVEKVLAGKNLSCATGVARLKEWHDTWEKP